MNVTKMADPDQISNESIFSDIDREFACFISGIDDASETVLAALLLSQTTMAGNICLYLPSLAGKHLADVIEGIECNTILPQLDIWTKALQKSPAAGEPGDFVPMILDGRGRLYLQRYWYYEDMLARSIKKRVEDKTSLYVEASTMADLPLLLDSLFPSADNDSSSIKKGCSESQQVGEQNKHIPTKEIDWQKVAAAASLLNHFTVISGGPGTGKTTTIARILIALCLLEAQKEKKLSAAVTAPTGKAAARLMESINSALENLSLPPHISGELLRLLKESIPTEPHTIHRLLGYRHGSAFFRHNSENPLPYDLVIVDESSMADLPLMAKLFDALPLKSRIILLGDNNQLSSVESGAVLGDICSGPDGFTKEFANKIATMGSGLEDVAGSDVPLVADSIVMLKKSFRFDQKSGIGALSSLVNGGKSDEAIKLLLNGQYTDVRFIELKDGLAVDSNGNLKKLDSLIESIAMKEYRNSLMNLTPHEAFDLLTRFRILTPIRKGQGGVEDINTAVHSIAGRDLYSRRANQGGFYSGLPVIVKRNEYGMGLYNGDIGIFLNDKDGLRVFFQGQNGFRKFMPGRLPEHEIAYALTVHKSQGSEFDRVLLVIPESKSPVLTREMLYTGITRAKQEIIIVASRESILRMVENPVKRHSGLTEALWDS